jgi:hypothetical protein
MMDQGQGNWFSLSNVVNGDAIAADGHIWTSEMLERSDDGYAGGVNQIAIVGKYMNVCSKGETLETCYDTK